MTRVTIDLPADTAARVQEALNGQTVEEFAAEAMEQHARRRTAARKLREAVEEAEASGEPIEITSREQFLERLRKGREERTQ